MTEEDAVVAFPVLGKRIPGHFGNPYRRAFWALKKDSSVFKIRGKTYYWVDDLESFARAS